MPEQEVLSLQSLITIVKFFIKAEEKNWNILLKQKCYFEKEFLRWKKIPNFPIYPDRKGIWF